MIMRILGHLPGFARWGLYGTSSDRKGDGGRARQGHTGRGLCWPEVFLRGGNRSPAGAALRPHRLSAPRAPGNAAALAPRAARALRPAAPIRPASAAEPGIGPGGRRRALRRARPSRATATPPPSCWDLAAEDAPRLAVCPRGRPGLRRAAGAGAAAGGRAPPQ